MSGRRLHLNMTNCTVLYRTVFFKSSRKTQNELQAWIWEEEIYCNNMGIELYMEQNDDKALGPSFGKNT